MKLIRNSKQTVHHALLMGFRLLLWVGVAITTLFLYIILFVSSWGLFTYEDMSQIYRALFLSLAVMLDLFVIVLVAVVALFVLKLFLSPSPQERMKIRDEKIYLDVMFKDLKKEELLSGLINMTIKAERMRGREYSEKEIEGFIKEFEFEAWNCV